MKRIDNSEKSGAGSEGVFSFFVFTQKAKTLATQASSVSFIIISELQLIIA
jgi:hypothetical protein